ncbi:MAG TPA: LysR family transcriptional regulator [Gammaproteobacteria bacterium]|nr:LysR family transcriptional regulator [Gammaproteobacteria bacterium]
MKTPRISIEQWRTLQAVVDHGGFAQAAEKLHRSQSSVSYSVAKLQDQLGLPVFEIEGRKAQLTQAGEALLRRSRHLLQQAQELESFARSLQQGWEAQVNLVVDTVFPTDKLMRALRRFEPVSQGCRVQLREVVLSGAEDALEEGYADLVICAHVPARFLGEPLLEIDFIAVTHPQHPLQQLNREVTVSDLEGQLQVVIQDSGLRYPKNIGWLGAEHRWSVSSVETAVAAVSEGLGYAWLPRHRIAQMLENSLLQPVPLERGAQYKSTLYIVHGRNQESGPGTRLLAELLHQEVM